VGAIALLAGAGCGDEDEFEGSPDPATERTDRPADPPAGFRVFVNRRAGFSLSVPADWVARSRRSATLIRSGDRLLALTVAADRSSAGRETRPRRYATKTFRALPGFRRLRTRSGRAVPHSPYPSWRVDGVATLARRRQRQRITVAAFRRPGRVTFTVVAFGAEVGGRGVHRTALETVLASLRGRRPAL
jgi:hypothetical protein